MARADSMAAIDAALQGIPSSNASVQQNNASPVAPHPAPGIQAPTPVSNAGKMTADEKRFVDAQRQAQTDEEKRAEKFSTQQQANQDAFQSSANATANAVQGVVKGTGVTLASLPTPGSLILPLVILLVFFLLLLPVNGHTRLVWMWLVLTGNAEVVQGASNSSNSGSGDFGGGAGGSFATSSTASSNGNGPATLNLSALVPLTTMTGVEDL